MSLHPDDSRLVSEKETLLTGIEQSVVSETLEELHSFGKAWGVPMAMDDRCAKIEAAMIRYIIESRGVVTPAPAPQAKPNNITPSDLLEKGYVIHYGQSEDGCLAGMYWWTLVRPENRAHTDVGSGEYATADEAAKNAREHLKTDTPPAGLNPAALADCMRFAAGLNDIPDPTTKH